MKYFYLLFIAASFQLVQAQPSSQPTNLQFSNVKAYGFKMKFTKSSATGFLVLKSLQNITDVPVDGVTYEKGQGLATSKVLSVGNIDSFSVREVVENTSYYFKVFAYSGNGGSINYLETNPLSGSVTSAASNPFNYYNSIDSSSGSFINDLHNLINNHIFISYSPGYRTTIIPAIYERDTIAGNAVINCEYSTHDTVYTPPFDFVATDYSREHALCRSWMKTYPDYPSSITSHPEGADFHNLLLTKQNLVNAVRANYPLGEVVNVTSQYKGTKYGFDSRNQRVFEPRDDKKGDVARSMMYQMVSYNGLNGRWALQDLLGDGPDQLQSVLKDWHEQDPVDKFERTKNEYIYSIQSNRNPFIDHPEWVQCINFDSLYKTSLCGFMTGIADAENLSFNLYPNPATNFFSIDITTYQPSPAVIEIFDMAGSRLYSENIFLSAGNNQVPVIKSLASGIYSVRLHYAQQDIFRKLIIAE